MSSSGTAFTVKLLIINMSVKFFNITKAEFLSKKLLHKYMPLERVLEMLTNQTLWFANPTIWKDPFEKRFIENVYNIGGAQKSFPWKDRVYCMCTTQTATSEAYWNAYSAEEIGVSIKFNRQVLLNELERLAAAGNRIYIGKVQYQKTQVIKGLLSNNPFLNPSGTPITSLGTEEMKVRLLLLKRLAYQYENEIRFFIVRNKTAKQNGTSLKYNIPNTDLIDSISLDPRIGLLTVDLLRKEFEINYGFVPVSRTQKRVQRSLLYAEEKPTTIKM